MRCSRCQTVMQTTKLEANAYAILYRHQCPACASTRLSSEPVSMRHVSRESTADNADSRRRQPVNNAISRAGYRPFLVPG